MERGGVVPKGPFQLAIWTGTRKCSALVTPNPGCASSTLNITCPVNTLINFIATQLHSYVLSGSGKREFHSVAPCNKLKVTRDFVSNVEIQNIGTGPATGLGLGLGLGLG